HRWSGKYEAHLWDSSCRVEGHRRKGKQVEGSPIGYRTQTLVKSAIVQVDAAPFKQWYLTHYGFLWYGKKLMVSFRNYLSCCFLLGYSIISFQIYTYHLDCVHEYSLAHHAKEYNVSEMIQLIKAWKDVFNRKN
ncbi:hypothetical protein ACJX0J_026383, partial [Zea mays]